MTEVNTGSRTLFDQVPVALSTFLTLSENEIVGHLTSNFKKVFADLSATQVDAWKDEITFLKCALAGLADRNVFVMMEYPIPRLGRIVDALLLIEGRIFILEFKTGSQEFAKSHFAQVVDYALDFRYFHEQSVSLPLIPVLIAQGAKKKTVPVPDGLVSREGIAKPEVAVTPEDLKRIVDTGLAQYAAVDGFDANVWANSAYRPSPSIVEAAKAMYSSHNVKAISQNEAGKNLDVTSTYIEKVIEATKKRHEETGRPAHAICFVTGVPGAGKTLVGLNLSCSRHDFATGEHAIFLSGNAPLVAVLTESLARDLVARTKNGRIIDDADDDEDEPMPYDGTESLDDEDDEPGTEEVIASAKMTKKQALSEVTPLIQLVHHYRDEGLNSDRPPAERIVIFDEAQRAWDKANTSKFMKMKKGRPNFDQSEAECLMSFSDRWKDWSVVVCLVGGGQEIFQGEAGIREWLMAVRRSFPDWYVYLSPKIEDDPVYLKDGEKVADIFGDVVTYKTSADLHLTTSMRSFRAQQVSEFVEDVLNGKSEAAKAVLPDIEKTYPLVMTRSLEKAKQWVKRKASGSERYGLMASSRAGRLKAYGVSLYSKIPYVHWFLADMDDVRSAYYCEVVATEFETQGLEIDWGIVAWGGDLRRTDDRWVQRAFKGTRWNAMKPEFEARQINSYRVLLTRSRQGMVIWIPEGIKDDKTNVPAYYDGTYNYLKSIGIPEI